MIVEAILAILVLIEISPIKQQLLNCKDNSILQRFKHTFVHGDIYHLLTNGITLYNLLDLENRLSPQMFLLVVVFLTVVTNFIHKAIDDKCSVGFSGVLFGLVTIRLGLDGFSTDMLIELAILLISPSLFSQNVSFTGHLAGVIAGLLLLVPLALNQRQTSAAV